jgi:hypothetical protein
MGAITRRCAFRFVAWIALAAFLSACTKQVPRGAPEARHFQVDWEQLEKQRVEFQGWVIEGVPLTPSQWPLEGSLKSLFSGDFEGVIDRFDLRFHSSKLEGDVLEELYDAGYVPVYVRVTNDADEPLQFQPLLLSLEVDGRTRLFAVTPEELPATFSKTDWGAAGTAVVVTTLMLVLVVLSAKQGNGGVRTIVHAPRAGLEAGGSVYRRGAAGESGRPDTRGLLTAVEVRAGERAEGFVFFRLAGSVADWSSLRLMAP